MAFPNPFYQIYEGSAKASRAKIIHMNLTKEGGFKPNLDEDSLREVDLVVINTQIIQLINLLIDELKRMGSRLGTRRYDFLTLLN